MLYGVVVETPPLLYRCLTLQLTLILVQLGIRLLSRLMLGYVWVY